MYHLILLLSSTWPGLAFHCFSAHGGCSSSRSVCRIFPHVPPTYTTPTYLLAVAYIAQYIARTAFAYITVYVLRCTYCDITESGSRDILTISETSSLPSLQSRGPPTAQHSLTLLCPLVLVYPRLCHCLTYVCMYFGRFC
ncbi:hypothetical protein GGR55DRAFT_628458 [Xylaria sp. FL0064]|nr:hypothetical protein GGR55DRAFT_628458 [Xylaria sp. FL0064]